MIWVGPVGKTLLLRITWADRGSREGLCQYLPTFYWSFIFILCEIVNELKEKREWRKEGWPAGKSKQTIGREKEVNIQMDDKRKKGDIAFSVPWKKLLFFPGHAANSEDGTKQNGARVPCMRRSIGKRPNSLCLRWNGGQSSKVKNDYAGLSTLFAKKALWRVHLRWNDVRIWSKLELSRDWLEAKATVYFFFYPISDLSLYPKEGSNSRTTFK